MTRKLLHIALIAIACCALALFAGCGGSSGSGADPDDGQAAVDDGSGSPEGIFPNASEEFGDLAAFQGMTLDGAEITQDVFAQADVTLVNFWGTYCGPCLEEMPELAEFAKQLPDNVQLITACIDVDSAGVEVAQRILDEAGYDGITIAVGEGDYEAVYGNLMYVPTTIAFDSQGKALVSLVGSPENVAETYGELVDAALAEAGAAGGGA